MLVSLTWPRLPESHPWPWKLPKQCDRCGAISYPPPERTTCTECEDPPARE